MLVDDYRNAIRAKNYSPKTFEAYWPHVVNFLRFCKSGTEWRRPEQLNVDDVTRFLTWLAVRQNVSASTQNQALSALLFLYRYIVKRPLENVDAVRAKKPKNIPVVMSRDEVSRLLKNLKGVYDATLHAEYTPTEGRKCRITGFKRQRQSVWSLIGAALKQMGHTKHVSKKSEIP